jgi:pyruvate,orthophosphate dikinase
MATKLGKWLLGLDGHNLPERNLIGGKAWSIARMAALGLRVPPAIVITTDACKEYLATNSLPDGLIAEICEGIAWLEEKSGKSFGKGPDPLLVSVRSGAPVSMPGMMDTVLNLGINDETEASIAAACGDPAFAHDTHVRFLEFYAHIVLKADMPPIDRSASIDELRGTIAQSTGAQISQDAFEQLHGAIKAVFDSWHSRRAKRYRQHHNIPETLGTAVVIQAMVFGNMNENSGTGVLFSRNPLTGDPMPFGEYLPRAQGEDVVSGKHTPFALSKLHEMLPDVHDELLSFARLLEDAGGDMQDIEFTVERGTLYLLQTRSAKRAPQAAVKVAVDMVREGRISPDEALRAVTPEQVRILLSPRLADGAERGVEILARGEGASPGIGIGIVVASSDEAEERAHGGEQVVLAREITSPNDVHGMIAACAIITEQGGSTSHAAVVGRALGRPCVVGCGSGSVVSLAGKTVTVDGSAGVVYAGILDVVRPDEKNDPDLARLLKWASVRSSVRVEETLPENVTVFNTDDIEGDIDPLHIDELFARHADKEAVTGSLILTEEGSRAAIKAGFRIIIVKPRLPVLLEALRSSAQQQEGN